jgi:hypothetical protein
MSTYVEQWQDYRRRKNLLLFSVVGFLPVGVAFIFVTLLLFADGPHTYSPEGVFGFCWMALCAVAWIRFSNFRCPRCGNKFFIRRRFAFFSDYSMFAHKCMHCDLPKYSRGEMHAL